LLIREPKRCEGTLLSGAQIGKILMHRLVGLAVGARRIDDRHRDRSIW
jgi:hypothetical protein